MFDYLYEDKSIIAITLPDNLDIPSADSFTEIMPLAWDEHCLECSAPQCYSSCSMYEKSRSNKCKRTQYGIRRISYGNNTNYSYGVQLRFRKWGKLLCSNNNSKSYQVRTFQKFLPLYETMRNLLFYIGLPFNFVPIFQTDLFAWLWHVLLVRQYKSSAINIKHADGLIVSLFSHSAFSYSLILEAMENDSSLSARLPLLVHYGFNQFYIPASQLDLNSNTDKIALYPSNNEEAEITFFLLDKVRLNVENDYIVSHSELFAFPMSAKYVKCVIWDLDNTLWDGIIGEDGLSGIKLRSEVADVIYELDKRGILCSIVSKNDYDLAWKALEQFGLSGYFLYPQINWNSKSNNILHIAELLNIHINTFAFVDDTLSERLEVTKLCPGVRVYPETEVVNLLTSPPFDVLVSEDSKKRRLYYKAEETRQNAYEGSGQDNYNQFLISCNYEAKLFIPSNKSDLDRSIELFQRTNQLNASGRRIQHNELETIMKNKTNCVYTVSCIDKYGDYGIVGCFILDISEEFIITDFVMSCRIAKRKIENAIVWSLMQYNHVSSIMVQYIPTDRNTVLLRTFQDMGGVWQAERNIISIKKDMLLDYDLCKVDIFV